MTYGEMERACRSADLCGSCAHREVCPVPVELAERQGWHLAVATCAHYDAEGDTIEKFVVRQNFAESFDPDRTAQSLALICEEAHTPPLAARWRLAWAEVAGAYTRDLLRQAEAQRTPNIAEARLAERLADRELQAARREYERATEDLDG